MTGATGRGPGLTNPQCVDIEFVEPNDARIAEVNATNCFNSTDIGFSDVYNITTKPVGGNATSGAGSWITSSALRYHDWLHVALGGLMVLL